jgi:dipeptidase E
VTGRRLLLLSNSSTAGMSYLEHALGALADFLGEGRSTVLFVPYAAVRFSYDEYEERVRQVLAGIGHDVRSIHRSADPAAAVRDAEAVAVGGGNTFQLVHRLRSMRLIGPLRERIAAGVPFIGWSAGSNLACPTLRTTNDMPIVEPASFETLSAVPFQINPHYLDAHPDGHMGETREERIQEFLFLNPDTWVVGLREGSSLRVEGESVRLLGGRPARLFRSGEEPREIEPHQPLDFLLD